MEPGSAPGAEGRGAAGGAGGAGDTSDTSDAPATIDAGRSAEPPGQPISGIDPSWTPGVPSVRELLPSLIFGAALPIAAYFAVRPHVNSDAEGLIVAGSFSVGWILIQFVRNRQLDFVGAIVLFGFLVGVVSSTVLGGNAYVLKVRDAFFTAIFGIACIVTVYTHDRPALFYVSRYLSAGNDPAKVAVYNQLHEMPTARHTFRVLSVLWGIGLFVEATARMTLAEVLHTSTYIAVSPFITAVVIGSLFAFTVLYSKRAQSEAAQLMTATAQASGPPSGGPGPPDPTATADQLAPANRGVVPPAATAGERQVPID